MSEIPRRSLIERIIQSELLPFSSFIRLSIAFEIDISFYIYPLIEISDPVISMKYQNCAEKEINGAGFASVSQ